MSGRFDLIILALFLICVAFVVRRAIDNLENITKIDFDSKALQAELEKRTFGDVPLSQLVDVKFKFDRRYSYDYEKPEADKQPKTLEITIENKSDAVEVYADWDRSVVTNYDGSPARRIIRLDGSKQLADLTPPKSQAPNAIPPKMKLTTSITPEDLLAFDKDKSVWAPGRPIIDLLKLKQDSKRKEPQFAAAKKIYKSFEARQDGAIQFQLSLMLRLVNQGSDFVQDQLFRIPCHFKITKMPWFDHLPWNPPK